MTCVLDGLACSYVDFLFFVKTIYVSPLFWSVDRFLYLFHWLDLISHSTGLQVPSRLQQSFLVWKKRLPQMATPFLCVENPNDLSGMVNSVSFPPVLGQRGGRLRAESCADQRFQATNHSIGKMSQLHSLSRILSHRSASENPRENLKRPRKQRRPWLHAAPERDSDSILSLHTQLYCLESYTNTIEYEPLTPKK